MKKVIFILLLSMPCISFAQYKYYKDSTYSQTFNYLNAATSVNSGAFWDSPDYVIPIGFMFHLFDDSTNTLYLTPDGGADAVVNIHPIFFSTPYNSCIITHGSDLKDRDTSGVTSQSPISYSLSGTSPSRIFKLEWRNAGFEFGATADSINLQLWLYETSNIIEMRFGEGNYTSPLTDLYNGAPGPWVGLVDSIDRNASNVSARIFYQLKGPVASPVLDSSTTIDPLTPVGMTGHPASGAVYRFTPKKAGAGSVGYESYSTRVSHDIRYEQQRDELIVDIFSEDDFYIQLMDINGKIISTEKMKKGRTYINANSLTHGMYVVQLRSLNEQHCMKFIR